MALPGARQGLWPAPEFRCISSVCPSARWNVVNTFRNAWAVYSPGGTSGQALQGVSDHSIGPRGNRHLTSAGQPSYLGSPERNPSQAHLAPGFPLGVGAQDYVGPARHWNLQTKSRDFPGCGLGELDLKGGRGRVPLGGGAPGEENTPEADDCRQNPAVGLEHDDLPG